MERNNLFAYLLNVFEIFSINVYSLYANRVFDTNN